MPGAGSISSLYLPLHMVATVALIIGWVLTVKAGSLPEQPLAYTAGAKRFQKFDLQTNVVAQQGALTRCRLLVMCGAAVTRQSDVSPAHMIL